MFASIGGLSAVVEIARLVRAGTVSGSPDLGAGGHYVADSWLALERQHGGWRSRGIRVCSVRQSLASLVAEFQAFDAVMLTAYPGACDLLAEEQSAGRLQVNPVMIELGGESLSQEVHTRIAAAFGCPVRDL